jgi:hypothetical protein
MSPSADTEKPFTLGEVLLHHRGVERGAMVITPKKPIVVGAARLQQVRHATALSPVERWLLEQIESRGDRARVVLFRAVNDKRQRVWEFDASLSETELKEAGYVMSKALLPFHRRMLARGVVLMVHTDWGLRECHAMRHGIRLLVHELDAVPERNAVEEADRWVLSHMLLHVALGLDHVTTSLLPRHLTMIERRYPSVLELVSRLPPDAID